jgi:hypothetical protein
MWENEVYGENSKAIAVEKFVKYLITFSMIPEGQIIE